MMEEERARGGDGDEGESARGFGQLRGVAGSRPGRWDAGRQGGGGWTSAGARRPRARPSSARRKATEEAVGWAGLLQGWARGKCFLPFSFSYFLFYFICFASLFN